MNRIASGFVECASVTFEDFISKPRQENENANRGCQTSQQRKAEFFQETFGNDHTSDCTLLLHCFEMFETVSLEEVVESGVIAK